MTSFRSGRRGWFRRRSGEHLPRSERRPARDLELPRLGRDGRFLPDYVAFDDEV